MLRVPIRDCKAGTRVRKPDAILFDFAFERTGTVHRETFEAEVGNAVHRHEPAVEHIGVLWDGGHSIFEYPGDTVMEVVED